PSIRHIIALTLVLSVGGLLGSNLDQTLVLQNPVNYQTSEVLNSYVFKMGIQQGDFSYATAVGLLVSVVSLILVVGSHTITKRISDQSVF
ncbi:MAG: sugar ABC transporter permease, partial [Enterococcus aquimarinus]|nr:sugar ABC transporter permease [Enterococcus aquimarinus]